jgi:tellurite methyltransferase
MQRPIEGYQQDEHGDWVALLRCGHGQHVRHKPPFWSRPWVTTEEGRAARLGAELACVLCDRFELPKDFQPYKRTADFTTGSIPDALRRDHSTKPGVWGVINVLEGRLRYLVELPLVRDELLEPGSRGIIVPEVRHRVEPEGEVRFFVEFYRLQCT